MEQHQIEKALAIFKITTLGMIKSLRLRMTIAPNQSAPSVEAKEFILVEIPTSQQRLKYSRLNGAKNWNLKTQSLSEKAFQITPGMI